MPPKQKNKNLNTAKERNNMSLRDDILSRPKNRNLKTFYSPTWERELHIVPLTLRDTSDLIEARKKNPGDDLYLAALFIVLSLRDADGNKEFSDDDVEELIDSVEHQELTSLNEEIKGALFD